jgi:hypothetical protein
MNGFWWLLERQEETQEKRVAARPFSRQIAASLRSWALLGHDEQRRRIWRATDGVRSTAADGCKEKQIQSSQLLVRNLVVNDEKLKGLFSRAMELLRQFDSYRTNQYIVTNKLADRLANRAIDQTLRQAG